MNLKNKRVFYVCLLVMTLLISGCNTTGIKDESTDNPNIPVTLLFEHEGIKVYRFKDRGESIYFTDARGKTMKAVVRGNGKSSYIERQEIETVE